MPRTPAPVLGALHLRAWALSALCTREPPPAPPPVAAEGWSRFLRTEQCALTLAERAWAVLPAQAAATVAAFARTESRRVLSARGQLKRVDALAARRGLRVVVLKGGVPLLRSGAGPQLVDLDLLAAPAEAAALAAALDAEGYHAHGAAASHRLALRSTGYDVPLEIHTSVPGLPGEEVWRRVQPAPGASALRLLHPADHLRYLLLHSAVQHADRRGRLRDLLLIAEALAHCSAEDEHEVEAAVSAEPEAAVLAQQLVMARAVARRTGPVADSFELTAAGTYVLTGVLARPGFPAALRGIAWQTATAAVARRGGTPASLGQHGLTLPSAVPVLASLRRVSPRMERAARLLVRRWREWALFPLGVHVAGGAARAVRERAACVPDDQDRRREPWPD